MEKKSNEINWTANTDSFIRVNVLYMESVIYDIRGKDRIRKGRHTK